MSVYLPCLFQRWGSSGGDLGAARRFNTWQDVRADVMRNIEWLLNTEQPTRLAGVDLPPAVMKSVLAFGIPAYSGKVRSSFQPDEVAWNIKRCIIQFEPRVDPAFLDVTPDTSRDNRFNRLRFAIHGVLRADELRDEFIVLSEIDLESGTARLNP